MREQSCKVLGVRIRGVESVLQAEIMAILQGFKVVVDLSLPNTVVESDCLLAVKEIQRGYDSYSEWSPLVQDICDLMSLNNFYSVVHVRRTCNMLADVVAKTRCLIGDYTVWVGSLPPDVYFSDVIS
ncbi:hypothetical protein PTKIN_Ptkin18bG0023700 [Pterospermum kingtungense]